MKSLPTLVIHHGDDEFAVSEHIAALRAALDPASADFNTTELNGPTTTLTTLRQAADAFPFLSEKRLVIVYGYLSHLLGKGKSAADDTDALLAYLPKLPESTCLAFADPTPLDERSRFVKALSALPGIQIHKHTLPKGPERIRWVEKRAKAYGGQFNPRAAAALADAIGDDPRALDSEVLKLLTYVNFARPVEPADVARLTPSAPAAQIWDVVDALGERNGRKAMHSLHALLAQPGQDAPAIFAMIVRQYRLLLQARAVIDAGGGPAQIAAAMKVHDFVSKKIYAQARNYPPERLVEIYRTLLDTDLRLKTSDLDPDLALDLLVGELTAK